MTTNDRKPLEMEHIQFLLNPNVLLFVVLHSFIHVLFLLVCQSFYGYGDLFSETWRAFTDYDIVHLKTYDSKRVCTTSFFSFNASACTVLEMYLFI